ncbi:MAG: glycosyltransferase family 4 protein [Bdellovibrionota bacterium]
MSREPDRHVCHVFPSLSWGGAEIYAVKLATWQHERGQRVSVWTLPGSRMAREARERGLDVIESKLPQRQPFVALPEIVKIIRAKGVTHLHHHWAGGPWTFLGARLFASVRELVHMHLWISRDKKDLVHRVLYRGLDRFIVAGDRAAQAARELLPLAVSQIAVVPYAMDLEKFSNLPKAPFDLPSSGRIVAMFARLDEQKGTMELLRAAETFLRDLPDVTLVIMGDANVDDTSPDGYAAHVKLFRAAHEFSSRIVLLPFHKDYLGIMRQCSLVVAPSYHESYSLVFLDAFALGIPVLTTDIGGSPDLVPASRGWLAQPRDVQSLALGVKKALEDSGEIERRGRAARDYVFSHHSPDAVLARLESSYQ